MKILLENVNRDSTSGPNSFANKLIPRLLNLGCEVVEDNSYDLSLCFIQSFNKAQKPRVQRLDGIYFNTDQDYDGLNSTILRTYRDSSGVIFQSHFNKKLIEKYFGPHEHSTVIHNGADIETIDGIVPMHNEKYNNIWSCASSWRPHKRLNRNIEYFLDHHDPGDLLVVAGHVDKSDQVSEPNVVYFGNLTQNQLYSLYKASTNFIHLAWLDHCPNVVVDARASGCHIICSSTGGTREISGDNSTIIQEEEWDLEPTRLYKPPELNFARKMKNEHISCYDMEDVSSLYKNFMESVIKNENNKTTT